MPPKKTGLTDELEEFRRSMERSMEFLSAEVHQLAAEVRPLTDLMKDFKLQMARLIRSNNENLEKMVGLERKVDELEQQSRMGDVVISGLDIAPRITPIWSVNAATGVRVDVSNREWNAVETQVTKFLASNDIQLDANDISACYALPRKNKSTKTTVIVSFPNRRHKMALLYQGRKLKGTEVYMNENLTKKNAEIARDARKLKKDNKIMSTWTGNCKVFIKLNGTGTEPPKTLMVRELSELDAYK